VNEGMAERLAGVRRRIEAACGRVQRPPSDVSVVAVSKMFSPDDVRSAAEAGLTVFGESRVQEAKQKIPLCPGHLTWHMVGHLQSNKAKAALEIFDIIHSVDSIRLAGILNRLAKKQLPILLEVNVSGESTKAGFSPDEVAPAVKEMRQLPNLNLMGLMTVAPMTAEPEEVRPVFRKLREMRDSLGLKHLSMGMTDDFELAVAEGSTMIRIGTGIFSPRKHQ